MADTISKAAPKKCLNNCIRTDQRTFFTAHRGLGFFYYIIYTVLQCGLPPLRPHSREGGPGPRFEPGTGGSEAGTLISRSPHLLQTKDQRTWILLNIGKEHREESKLNTFRFLVDFELRGKN